MHARAAHGRARGRSPLRAAALAVALCASALACAADTAAQEVSDGTLAAGIRASNHPCRQVIGQETVSTKPMVLRVRCNSGVFKVTVSGGSVSAVEPAD